MKVLSGIFRFYINSSIHVSLAICSLILITLTRYKYPIDIYYLAFSFFASVVAYNFVKYSKVAKLYHRRLTKSMKAIQIFTLLSVVLFTIFITFVKSDTVLSLLPFAFLTLLYAIPVYPNSKNLRSISGVKIFIIGCVWVGVTVVAPVVHSDGDFNQDIVIEMVQRFLFIVVMMLPFEVRDLPYDPKELNTIPQQIGVTRTKFFGSILLILFLLLSAFKNTYSSVEALSTAIITIISLLFLWGTSKEQSEYYCSFWVESIPIFWMGIYLILLQIF